MKDTERASEEVEFQKERASGLKAWSAGSNSAERSIMIGHWIWQSGRVQSTNK